MMRNSKLSTEPEAKRPALILRCGKFNNFIAWKHEQMEQCAVEYGFQANVMKTGVAYMPRPVVESDYMPAVSEDVAEELPALSAASVATLRLEAEKERNKEVRALKLALPRLYATIMMNVSPESKEEIRQHPDFEAADLAKDANVLWRIITETHLTAVHGVSDSMRVFDQMSLRTRFARLRQKHGVSIGVFKQEYDELKATLIGAGVPAMPDSRRMRWSSSASWTW
jgi:hypothetical protein